MFLRLNTFIFHHFSEIPCTGCVPHTGYLAHGKRSKQDEEANNRIIEKQ